MKHLTLPASLAIGGLACGATLAQPVPVVHYTLHWSDIGGTSNGVIEPGESVAFVVDASFTPPVGTTVSYPTPPPPGMGTVAGLGSIWFDLLNTCGEASGTWTLSGQGFNGTTGTNWGRRAGWVLGGAGTPQPDGSVINIEAGQFPVPGTTANSLNPIVEIWRGKWTPSSFTVRSFTFTARTAAAGAPNAAVVLVQYGTTTGGLPQYVGRAVQATESSVTIPIGMGVTLCTCYANCDSSTVLPILTVNDFVCFLNRFAAGDSYANCDGSSIAPALNVNDFTCFLNRYAAGCP